jgi:hypothetical protein
MAELDEKTPELIMAGIQRPRRPVRIGAAGVAAIRGWIVVYDDASIAL